MASENCDKRISPSSTAKIMTACIVLESGINLQKEITVTANMIKDVVGRTMLLKEGDVLTVEDLLYAMICGGYNDATHILALNISPVLYKFTEKMNEKAQELHMDNTHYVNPTGMTKDGMYTTVNDIAKLAKYMINNELFVNICSTKYYKLSDKAICDYKTITNRSSLLSEYSGLANFNTGSGDYGDCSVLFYNNDELSLISIVMNANSNDSNNHNNLAEIYSKKLISHAKNKYTTQRIKTQQDIITSLPVKYSTSSKEINIYPQEDVKVFLSKDISIKDDLSYSIYIYNGELTAPLNAGDTVGILTIFNNEVMLASIPLIIHEDIDRNTFLYSMDMLKQFVLSKVFFLSLIIFLIFILCYLFKSKQKFKKKKRKTKKPT
jgi:D-alanyl-D-alanine carboxypeptidase